MDLAKVLQMDEAAVQKYSALNLHLQNITLNIVLEDCKPKGKICKQNPESTRFAFSLAEMLFCIICNNNYSIWRKFRVKIIPVCLAICIL